MAGGLSHTDCWPQSEVQLNHWLSFRETIPETMPERKGIGFMISSVLNNPALSLHAGLSLPTKVLQLTSPFLYDLQQQLIGGIYDAPREQRPVVVEVSPSKEHGQTSTPFPPNC